jgi:hypothetical protein
MAGPSFEPGQPSEPHSLYVPGHEPTAHIPPSVADKILRIREHAEDLHRQLPETSERMAANTERGDAQRRLDRLLAHPHDGGFGLNPETDPRVVQQRRLIAELTIVTDRLQARYERVRQAFQIAGRTRTAIENFLRDYPRGTTIQEHVAEPPKLAKSEDILAAIARLERRCRELRADLHRVASAPLPLSHARERAREIVQTLARAGAPNVSPLIEHESGETPSRRELYNQPGDERRRGATGVVIPRSDGRAARCHACRRGRQATMNGCRSGSTATCTLWRSSGPS